MKPICVINKNMRFFHLLVTKNMSLLGCSGHQFFHPGTSMFGHLLFISKRVLVLYSLKDF